MSKIAFVAGWYNFGNKGISDDNRLMFNTLYDSAKKNFLPNHDVDFIFLTNDDTIHIDDVINIKFNHFVLGYHHCLLMKVLSLRYIENVYDYIFVSDHDQIITNVINDSDLLLEDMYILQHFFNPTVKSIYYDVTNPEIMKLNFDISKYRWTMGNFYGGKSKIIKEYLNFVEIQHSESLKLNYMHPGVNFYAKYPDEFFLIKYVYENDINYKILNSSPESTLDVFLSDFVEDENLYPTLTKAKILHNTKKNLELLKKIKIYYK